MPRLRPYFVRSINNDAINKGDKGRQTSNENGKHLAIKESSKLERAQNPLEIAVEELLMIGKSLLRRGEIKIQTSPKKLQVQSNMKLDKFEKRKKIS